MKSCSMDIAAVPPSTPEVVATAPPAPAKPAQTSAPLPAAKAAPERPVEKPPARKKVAYGGVGYGHMVISTGGEMKDVFGPKKSGEDISEI